MSIAHVVGQFDVNYLHGQSQALNDQSVLLAHLSLLSDSLGIYWLHVGRQSGRVDSGHVGAIRSYIDTDWRRRGRCSGDGRRRAIYRL